MLAITNARILPIDGPEIEPGTILLDGSTIAAVGADVTIPGDAEIIDAAGQWALPGLLDAHTHLGVHEEGIGWEGSDTNENTDPVTPHVRALDGINPEELGLRDAASHGVTTAVVLPG
ncbi:MAG: amidohydrolase, partial [Dehalococcoidia bacterium]|nr:amidohydrolase [Dehalococcoidia bacterium]